MLIHHSSFVTTLSSDKRSAIFEMKPILLRIRQAAKLCNVAPKTWRSWSLLGKIPKPIKLGKLHFWRYDELVRWIEAGCPSRKLWDIKRKAKVEPEPEPVKVDISARRRGRGIINKPTFNKQPKQCNGQYLQKDDHQN
jgi:hypothetical protein